VSYSREQKTDRSKSNFVNHSHAAEIKIQGRVEVTVRRGRRRKELLGGLKEERGYEKLKEEALDRTVFKN
jgi:hypothetical protein